VVRVGYNVLVTVQGPIYGRRPDDLPEPAKVVAKGIEYDRIHNDHRSLAVALL
jgi:hypothetical protein